MLEFINMWINQCVYRQVSHWVTVNFLLLVGFLNVTKPRNWFVCNQGRGTKETWFLNNWVSNWLFTKMHVHDKRLQAGGSISRDHHWGIIVFQMIPSKVWQKLKLTQRSHLTLCVEPRYVPANIAVASLIGSGMFPMLLTSDPSASGRGREDMPWMVLRSCSSFRISSFCSALVRTAAENSTCSSV